jgi:phosphoketolase
VSNALSPDLLRKMQTYWSAANYLSVGQVYLQDNPLLDSPLTLAHIKARLLGHWGTTPGLNFLYVHLNRLIKDNNLNMMYIIGPGHGGPGLVAQNLFGRIVYGALSSNRAEPKRTPPALSPVFLALRDPQSCFTRDPGLHSRRRRTRLFTGARLWCGL